MPKYFININSKSVLNHSIDYWMMYAKNIRIECKTIVKTSKSDPYAFKKLPARPVQVSLKRNLVQPKNRVKIRIGPVIIAILIAIWDCNCNCDCQLELELGLDLENGS